MIRLTKTRLLGAAITSAVVTLAVVPGTAYAAGQSTGTGTATTTVQAGLLSVGTIGTMATTMNPVVGATANGTLPSAQWSDATGSGAGWNGTVAVSPLTATGAWAASSGALALTNTAAGAFSDTIDGVVYTVKPSGTPSAITTPFSYTSNDSADASGTGSATNGSATAVGSKGLTITFDSAKTYSTSASYTVMAGTQAASSLVVATASAAAVTSTNTASAAPIYTNNGTALASGSVVGTVNSAGAVKVLSAALGTGASGLGYYTAAPGVTITADSSSWAKTYTATVQYSIVTGP